MRLWPQSSQRSTCPPSAAERQLLDRRHHLELAEAHMPGIGLGASRPHGDERRLRPPASGGAPPPGYAPGLGLPSVSGASRSSGLVTAADRGIGDAGVKRRGVELGMAERTRAIMRTFYVIETEGSAEQDSMLAGGATLSARDTRPGPPP